MKKLFYGVYEDNRKLFTKNLVPGRRVYNEILIKKGETEYRSWNPYRSKMAAAIVKGLRKFPIKKDSSILYLGVANGTTASHFSDIAVEGLIYGIETSFKSLKKFVNICNERKNMLPVLTDANKPWTYAMMIDDVDLVYQDISQRNQVEIFLKNMEKFDAKIGVIMVKARSIDVSISPKRVFDTVKNEIKDHYTLKEVIKLTPYAKDHIGIVVGS